MSVRYYSLIFLLLTGGLTLPQVYGEEGGRPHRRATIMVVRALPVREMAPAEEEKEFSSDVILPDDARALPPDVLLVTPPAPAVLKEPLAKRRSLFSRMKGSREPVSTEENDFMLLPVSSQDDALGGRGEGGHELAAAPEAAIFAMDIPVAAGEMTAVTTEEMTPGEDKSPAPSPEGYVSPQYQIRTGDTLDISIPYEVDSNRSVPVRPDGRINYLFDIEVMAAGKTYAQLNADLSGQLARYYKNPRVTVIGKSFAGNAVYVMGPVGRPGRHEIHNDSRLLDILSIAGAMSLIPQTDARASGQTKDVVDLERAMIIRGDNQLSVNFNDLLQGKNIAKNNISLFPGDFIYLPSSYSAHLRVYIVGSVQAPKVHYYSGDLTFMAAMAEAEGVINGAAWVRRCYVIRGGVSEPKKVIRVDYAALLKGSGEDLVLESGDVVYVPKNPLFQVNEVLTSVVQPLRTVVELDDIAKNQFREGHRMYKDVFKSRFWH